MGGNKYSMKVQCKIKINLGESCEEMELSCNPFNLAKGSIMSVKVGKNKAKKFKKKKFNDVTADDDTLVMFKSKKKVSTGADCTMSCTSPVPTTTTEEPEPEDEVPSNEEYCDYSDAHTMCIYPGPSDTCGSNLIFSGLSEEAKQLILDR